MASSVKKQKNMLIRFSNTDFLLDYNLQCVEIRKCTVLNERSDGSIDVSVTPDPYHRSGANMHIILRNLLPNGNVRWIWYNHKFIDTHGTWKRVFFTETRNTALLFLLIAKRLNINKDVSKLIAKKFCDSFENELWENKSDEVWENAYNKLVALTYQGFPHSSEARSVWETKLIN